MDLIYFLFDLDIYRFIIIEVILVVLFLIFARHSRLNGGVFDRRIITRRMRDRRVPDSRFPNGDLLTHDRRIAERRSYTRRSFDKIFLKHSQLV